MLTELLNHIQAKRPKLTIGDIAKSIGYTREYLTRAKKAGVNEAIEAALKNKYKEELQDYAVTDVDRIVYLEAAVSVLQIEMAKILAGADSYTAVKDKLNFLHGEIEKSLKDLP